MRFHLGVWYWPSPRRGRCSTPRPAGTAAAQPAIFQLIGGEIGAILNAMLFVRSKRRCADERPRALHRRAEALLNDVEQSRHEAVAISKGHRGLLRVVCSR